MDTGDPISRVPGLGVRLHRRATSIFKGGRLFPVLIALFASLTICVSTVLARIELQSLLPEPCAGDGCESEAADLNETNSDTQAPIVDPATSTPLNTATSTYSPTKTIQPQATNTIEPTLPQPKDQDQVVPTTSTGANSSPTPEQGNGNGGGGNSGQGVGGGNNGQGGGSGNGNGKNK